jgi:hypothetical protein
MGNFDTISRLKNAYFHIQDEYDNEKLLYELLVNEAYNQHGVCMTYYVISYDTSANEVFAEDGTREVDRFFKFMAFYELPREEQLFTKFGIAGLDNFHIYISKRLFETASKYNCNEAPNKFSSITPRVGDIIRSTYNNYLYEIVSVKDTEQQFLQEQHTWDIIVAPYTNKNFIVRNPLPE